MRTTLKRGVGRSAHLNGNGHGAVFPPGAASSVVRYRQPPPPQRSGLGLLGRILLVTLLVLFSVAVAIAGGAYLYLHQTVARVRAHSTDVRRGQQLLDVKLPGRAAIALVIGYDHRAGVESGLDSRSDTLMLIRADPVTKTVSLLSFPRDLVVDIKCRPKGHPKAPPVTVARDRINVAYATCGSSGTLETVKALTGLPVNFLITVNFHGFKQIVDKLGGVWMDVDRRYYNRNVGTSDTNFADIDLQPGYQRLNAAKALEFVRFRHTDSDFTRLARQQQFVRAFKQQVAHNFDALKLPGIVDALTKNVEVGSKGGLGGKEVIRYALFGATLPPGHFVQTRLEDVTGINELSASQQAIDAAVNSFENPDLESTRVANASALGRKLRQKAPPPSQVTVTVLNGNGVPGSATNAAFALTQRGYRVLDPPNGAPADAPAPVFHTKVYFDPKQPRAEAAAKALAALVQPADVAPLPSDPQLRALDPGAMVVALVGQTFHGEVAPVPQRARPQRSAPYVKADRSTGDGYLKPLVGRVPFRLQVPTVLERASVADTLASDKPVRLYWIDKSHKAVRLVFRNGAGEFWGIEETNWTDAPVLADKSFHHILAGRQYDLYYSGSNLHMVVLRANGASYWVVNTLLDKLSNETMLAIAKGLRPLPRS